ncbi:NAD(P)H-dependent oxidoreductase [Acinetobacter baumannii]|uniref:NAD(P)H-dependent oxidoreductase n=1 Tax=Acinetobacter baumannii TaxID=470 RepID=UPI000B14099C|nr:NAD(P)H-dependent oxidoreductase [Acinetobacter baumannii]
MKLLHLDSSALGEFSATREIGQAVVQELKKHGPLEVTYRDLHVEPLPHFSKHFDSLSEEAQVDERILQQFEETDIFVLGEPYRVCRRLSILRECSDDQIKIYP